MSMPEPDDFSFDLDRALARIEGVDGPEPGPADADGARVGPGDVPGAEPEVPAGPRPLEGLRIGPIGVASNASDDADELPEIHEATPVAGISDLADVVGIGAVATGDEHRDEHRDDEHRDEHRDDEHRDDEHGTEQLDTGRAPLALVGVAAGDAPSIGAPRMHTGEVSAPIPPADLGLPRLPTLAPAPLAPPTPPSAAPTGLAEPGFAPPIPSTVRRPSGPRGKNAPRHRNLGARAFLVLLVLGGVVLAAVTWGRSYLFPDEWDAVLIPLVEDIEAATGLEFEDPVAVRLLPPTEYGAAAATLLLGDDWNASIPRWRAAGLVSGEPDPSTVHTALAAAFPALYDPGDQSIISSEGLAGRARTVALNEALVTALVDQHLNTTLEPDERPALGNPDRARAARVVAAHVVAVSGGASPSRVPLTGLAGVPAPVAYEILAVDRLGPPLAQAIGVGRSDDGALVGLELTDLDVLKADGTPAPPGQLAAGELVDGEARTLGVDEWLLSFGGYLDATLSADMAGAIAADLFIPTARASLACMVATFSPTSADAATFLGVALEGWAAAAPADALAAASALADGTQQLVSCDPGPAAEIAVRSTAAAELVARQATRLTR